MKIEKVAIKYDNKIFVGYDYQECCEKLFDEVDNNYNIDLEKINEGFLTDENKFVDREKAYIIALNAGQINRDKNNRHKILDCEDMYIYWLHEKDKEIEYLHSKLLN